MAGAVPCLRRVEYICGGTAGQRCHEGDDGGSAGGADDWRAFGRLCFVIFGRSIMMCGMNTFLALYWIHELGQTERAGSAALSVYYAMGAICTLLGGRLADRFGCRRMKEYAERLHKDSHAPPPSCPIRTRRNCVPRALS